MPVTYKKLHERLLENNQGLKTQLEDLESAVREDGVGYSNHMADDGTDAFDQAVGAALKRKVKASLEEIERALAKFDNGTYGICEACGARIDRARLEVLPQAMYCLDCQARYEQGGTRAASR